MSLCPGGCYNFAKVSSVLCCDQFSPPLGTRQVHGGIPAKRNELRLTDVTHTDQERLEYFKAVVKFEHLWKLIKTPFDHHDRMVDGRFTKRKKVYEPGGK
jgi:hypothetical protein